MLKRLSVAALSLAMLAGSAAPLLAADTLNLVFLANTNDEEYDAALVLKDYVESRSDLTIEIFAGAQLCGAPRECFEALDAGVVDIYVATPGGTSVVFPPSSALDLPYLVSSDEVVNELMAGPYPNVLRKQLFDGTQGKFLMMSFSNTGGWRNYVSNKGLIRTPADIVGQKLRTIESHVQMEQVRLHGGSPTPIPFMEVYTALQTGVVDGTLNSVTDLVNAKLHERAKYMTLDGHNYMFCLWMMSSGRFNALTEDERNVLISGFDLMGRVQNGVQVRKELDAWTAFKKDGGQIYDPTQEEKDGFKAAVAPLRDWYLNEYGDAGKQFLEALDSALVAAEKIVDERHAAFMSLK